MADITMCSYLGCRLKQYCYRATAQPSQYQAYVTNPSKVVNGKFECEMYYGEPEHYLLEQMKSILRSSKKKK